MKITAYVPILALLIYSEKIDSSVNKITPETLQMLQNQQEKGRKKLKKFFAQNKKPEATEIKENCNTEKENLVEGENHVMWCKVLAKQKIWQEWLESYKEKAISKEKIYSILSIGINYLEELDNRICEHFNEKKTEKIIQFFACLTNQNEPNINQANNHLKLLVKCQEHTKSYKVQDLFDSFMSELNTKVISPFNIEVTSTHVHQPITEKEIQATIKDENIIVWEKIHSMTLPWLTLSSTFIQLTDRSLPTRSKLALDQVDTRIYQRFSTKIDDVITFFATITFNKNENYQHEDIAIKVPILTASEALENILGRDFSHIKNKADLFNIFMAELKQQPAPNSQSTSRASIKTQQRHMYPYILVLSVLTVYGMYKAGLFNRLTTWLCVHTAKLPTSKHCDTLEVV